MFDNYNHSLLVYLLDGAIRGGAVTLLILLLLKLLPINTSPKTKRLAWLLVLVLFIFMPFKNMLPGFAIEITPQLSAGHHTQVQLHTPFGNELTFQFGDAQLIEKEDQAFQQAVATSWQTSWHWCQQNLAFISNLHWPLILLSFWLTGTILFLCFFLLSYCRFLQKVKILPKIEDARIKQLFSTCCETILLHHHDNKRLAGRLKSITLQDSSSFCSPAVYGLRKPHILLPADKLAILNDKQICFILMHELIHVIQRDSLWNSINHLMLCVQWFNPFCHVANKHFRTTLELSCDNKVLTYMGRDQNIEYGNAILQMLELEQHSLPVPGIGLGKNMTEMKQRILMLKCKQQKKAVSFLTATIIFIALLLVGGSIGAVITESPPGAQMPDFSTKAETLVEKTELIPAAKKYSANYRKHCPQLTSANSR